MSTGGVIKMSTKSATRDLGSGKVSSLLFSLAVPAITAQIINVLYNIVDRIYIAHIPVIGTDALTGVGVTFPIITLISAFSYLVGSGGAPQAAIYMGKNKNDHAEKILGSCFSSLIIISILLTAFILIFQKPMLMLFGGSENTIGYAVDYLTIYSIGTIFIQLVLGLNTFISAQGFASIAMKTTVIGAILNIILDPILIFGLNMGVRGAAIATVFSQAVSCVWVLKFLTGEKTILRLRKQNLKPDIKIILGVFSLGVSPFIMQATESVLSICFNASLQNYGQDLAVGAMAILSSIMQFALLPVMGLTQGAQPITSYNYGAGNSSRVKECFKLTLICSFIYTALLWSVVFFKPHLIVSFFSNNQQLVDFASWAIRIYMGTTIFFGIQLACQQTFVALNEAKLSLFLAIFRKIILLIPLIFILPAVIPESFALLFVPEEFAVLLSDPAKVFSVFLAEPVSDFIAVATTATLFALNFNKILARSSKPEKKAN